MCDVIKQRQKFCQLKGNDYLVPDLKKIISAYEHGKKGPENICIPGDIRDGNKVCLWEMGGRGRFGWGLSMLIGTPDGDMIYRPILFSKRPKPNGRQSLARVWEGCVIMIGSYAEGTSTVVLFEIEQIISAEQLHYNDAVCENNAILSLKYIGQHISDWKDTESTIPKDYQVMVDRTLSKLSTKNAVTACYMNPWIYAQKNREDFKKQFEPFDVKSFDENKIIKTEQIGNLLMLLESEASSIASMKYIPVRQIVTKIDEDKFEVIMAILSPDKAKKDDPVEILYVYKTFVTPNTPVPMNTTAFLKADSFKEFKAAYAKGGLVDNWLYYRGCKSYK